MNILQLTYFLELSKRLSFKKTAEALYVSQPAISMQISSLESEWGVRLFVRNHRTISLTPSGEIMKDMLQNADIEFRTALIKAQRTERSLQSFLHFGVPEYSRFIELLNILADFQSRNPDVLLNVEVCPISKLIITDYDNKFDFVLNHDHILQNRKNLNILPYVHVRKVFLISNKHPLVQQHPNLSVYDLRDERLYIPGYTINSVSVNTSLWLCEKYNYRPKEIIDLSNVHSAILSAKMGFGVSMLDSMVDIPKEYDLRVLPTTEVVDYVIAWNKENRNPHVARLAEVLKQQIPQAII